MRRPNVLGLFIPCRPMLILAANEIRVLVPGDSDLNLVLINCFTPPLIDRDRPGAYYPPGVAAYEATREALAPLDDEWLLAWLPVPRNSREWFRNLRPASTQPAHLWIGPEQTLNEHLIATGHATRDQPMPSSPRYDGESSLRVEGP